jgi:hypothetical protein
MITNDKRRLSVLDTYLNVQHRKRKCMNIEERRQDRLSKLIRLTKV